MERWLESDPIYAPDNATRSVMLRPTAANLAVMLARPSVGAGIAVLAPERLAVVLSLLPSRTFHVGPPACKTTFCYLSFYLVYLIGRRIFSWQSILWEFASRPSLKWGPLNFIGSCMTKGTDAQCMVQSAQVGHARKSSLIRNCTLSIIGLGPICLDIFRTRILRVENFRSRGA